jgi:hypothetical protein
MLLTLPVELVQSIASYLTWKDYLSLELSHPYLRACLLNTQPLNYKDFIMKEGFVCRNIDLPSRSCVSYSTAMLFDKNFSMVDTLLFHLNKGILKLGINFNLEMIVIRLSRDLKDVVRFMENVIEKDFGVDLSISHLLLAPLNELETKSLLKRRLEWILLRKRYDLLHCSNIATMCEDCDIDVSALQNAIIDDLCDNPGLTKLVLAFKKVQWERISKKTIESYLKTTFGFYELDYFDVKTLDYLAVSFPSLFIRRLWDNEPLIHYLIRRRKMKEKEKKEIDEIIFKVIMFDHSYALQYNCKRETPFHLCIEMNCIYVIKVLNNVVSIQRMNSILNGHGESGYQSALNLKNNEMIKYLNTHLRE